MTTGSKSNGASHDGGDEHPVRFDPLTDPIYKPFRYPWAHEAWLTQQRLHWLPEEVPLADDVKDWHHNLKDFERNLLTQFFRFFTQADVEVNNCYMKHYSRIFKPTEVLMMLSAFSNTETIHIAAYSHLLDTIRMPEIEYPAFMKYKAMKDKYDFMQGFNVDLHARRAAPAPWSCRSRRCARCGAASAAPCTTGCRGRGRRRRTVCGP